MNKEAASGLPRLNRQHVRCEWHVLSNHRLWFRTHFLAKSTFGVPGIFGAPRPRRCPCQGCYSSSSFCFNDTDDLRTHCSQMWNLVTINAVVTVHILWASESPHDIQVLKSSGCANSLFNRSYWICTCEMMLSVSRLDGSSLENQNTTSWAGQKAMILLISLWPAQFWEFEIEQRWTQNKRTHFGALFSNLRIRETIRPAVCGLKK